MLDTAVEIIKSLSLLFVISAGYYFFLSSTKHQFSRQSRNCAIGILFGLLIGIVMLDPIILLDGVVLDPRGGPAMLAGVFGGPIAAIIAALVGSMVRWYVIGGPFALGGVIGFALYGLFGILARLVIDKHQLKLGALNLIFFGALGTVFVVPAFFAVVDAATAVQILKNAGPILLVNNILGALIVGLFIGYVNKSIETKKRLKKEATENAKLALITRNTTNGVVITDADGKTEWVNEGFVKITGYALEDMIGHKPGLILQGEGTDPKTVSYMSEQFKKAESFEVEILNYKKSGQPQWLQIACQLFTDPEGEKKYMAIESDITARKEVDLLKSNFVSLVSHELRTPLTSIMGSIGLVQSGALGPLTPEALDLMTVAKSNTETLRTLVNDILDFDSLDAGGLTFNFQTINAYTCLKVAIDRNQSYAEQYGVALVLESPQGAFLVSGDEERLIQVVSNLISNAVKFSPKGGTVTLTVENKGSDIQIKVRDHGTGIPKQFQAKVFEKFSQAEIGDTRNVKGSGLGLNIAKGIVEAHGGTISFDPDVVDGAAFYFNLPAIDQSDANSKSH